VGLWRRAFLGSPAAEDDEPRRERRMGHALLPAQWEVALRALFLAFSCSVAMFRLAKGSCYSKLGSLVGLLLFGLVKLAVLFLPTTPEDRP
jgi:hypothetical protein